MLWLIGGFLTFKWLYDKKVFSGKPSPAVPKRRGLPQRQPVESDGGDSADTGVGEDYFPEHQMIRPEKKGRAPAPKPPAEQGKPAAAAPPPKKEEISVPKGHKGSMDDIIEDDPDPGVGTEEFAELDDQLYNQQEEEEES